MKDDRKTKRRGSTDPVSAKPKRAATARPKAVASGRDKVAEPATEKKPRARKTPGRGLGKAAKAAPEAFEVAAAATVAGMAPIEPPAALNAASPPPAARPSAPVEFVTEGLRKASRGATSGAQAAAAPMRSAAESGAEQVRQASALAMTAGEQLRQVVSESAAVTTRAALEINGKVMDLMRAQGDATLALWRSALTAGSLPEAIALQSSAARQAYETSITHWKDLAETTGRVLSDLAKPIQSTWTDAAR